MSTILFGGTTLKHDEMPIGFSMALAMNPEAMEKFASLNETQKQKIIDGTHTVRSKEEMHQYVNKLLSEH